jgi:hypothetical protein
MSGGALQLLVDMARKVVGIRAAAGPEVLRLQCAAADGRVTCRSPADVDWQVYVQLVSEEVYLSVAMTAPGQAVTIRR